MKCKCGCGKKIIIKYKRYIPKYSVGHYFRNKKFSKKHRKNLSKAFQKYWDKHRIKKIKKRCIFCKKFFLKYPKQIKRNPTGKCCSKKCYYKAIKSKFIKFIGLKGKDHPMFGRKHKKSTLKLISETSQGRWLDKIHTRKTMLKMRRSALRRWNSKKKINSVVRRKRILQCYVCNKMIKRNPSSQKFTFYVCSKKCHGIMMKRKFSGKKSFNFKGGKVLFNCKICKKKIYRYKNVMKNRKLFLTCSLKCKSKAQSLFFVGNKTGNWLGGKSKEPYPPTWRNSLREEVRKDFGFRCQLCGVPQIECLTRLCVHHIDYNKENCTKINLIPLCLQCNSKVNCNRDFWKRFFGEVMKNVLSQSASIDSPRAGLLK